jgi:hypothetical protein
MAQLSREFAEQALAAKGRMVDKRAVDLQKKLAEQGLPLWDTQFQNGNVREATGSLTGYTPDVDPRIKGRTKKEVTDAMLAMPYAGPFYVQHAIVLMTKFGCVTTAKQQGILELNGVCMLGDGAKPLLHLFLSELVGFEVVESFRGLDLQKFVEAERGRWRAVALARSIPLIPALEKARRRLLATVGRICGYAKRRSCCETRLEIRRHKTTSFCVARACLKTSIWAVGSSPKGVKPDTKKVYILVSACPPQYIYIYI